MLPDSVPFEDTHTLTLHIAIGADDQGINACIICHFPLNTLIKSYACDMCRLFYGKKTLCKSD